ncbi:hypothetical protein IGI04_040505 [Brassica rapa subsp. trilocularis]|uniref:DUF3741 domain-containing protein n=1 Tax=Brassica rapa subsp. trilocularis TaxID=1813537 RepID=A0ABQ7KN15_BRACM|nr:hypothetical protein IGI04_040505 [Brassica rapa subsp. trilocularis]
MDLAIRADCGDKAVRSVDSGAGIEEPLGGSEGRRCLTVDREHSAASGGDGGVGHLARDSRPAKIGPAGKRSSISEAAGQSSRRSVPSPTERLTPFRFRCDGTIEELPDLAPSFDRSRGLDGQDWGDVAPTHSTLEGFREYLGTNPTITIEDALHDSKNFIKMDEDRRAYNAKQHALKPTASKTSNAQEPRQHAPYQKKGPVYAVTEDDQSCVVAAVREPGWNVWEGDTEGKAQQSRKPAPANSKSSYDQNKFCKYHDMRGHDTKECRHLYEAWLASTSDGCTEVEPPKPKTTKNSKSWSKSKDKKKKSNEKKEEDSPPTDDGDRSHHDEESTSDEEKPKARRKIFTIRATPSTTALPEDDLRHSLNQKSGKMVESPTLITPMEIDDAPPRISRSVRKLNVSDARHVLDAKRKDPLHRQDKLKREMLSNDQYDCVEMTDLRIKLNSKIPDLREKLKRCKIDRSKAEPEPIVPYQRKTQDLRASRSSTFEAKVAQLEYSPKTWHERKLLAAPSTEASRSSINGSFSRV